MKETAFEILYFYMEIAPYMVLGLLFVAILRRFVTKSMISAHLGGDGILSAFKGALFGVPLPLCSCGVVPSAIYFRRNGASKSSVISFLIATPQTGVDSIIATFGAMGPLFALFRPLAAFVSGIAGGTVAALFSDADNQLSIPRTEESCLLSHEEERYTTQDSFKYAFGEFLDDISVQFIFGVIIAGFISVLIPPDFFVRYGISSGLLAMGLMIALGIPMYVCATASIPIGLALLAKGVSPGAVFVFLAVGPLTNAASLSVLYRVFKGKMLALYVLSGTVSALIFGLILDSLYEYSTFGDISQKLMIVPQHDMPGLLSFESLLSVFFALLLAASLWRRIHVPFKRRR